MGKIQEAMDILAEARKRVDAVVIGYSGGKDSLAVVDMCARTFPRVECFMMEYLPGLRVNQERKDFLKQRWGLTCHGYPDPGALKALRFGIFCDAHWSAQNKIPDLGIGDIWNLVRADLKIRTIAVGYKRADSLWRRQNMGQKSFMRNLLCPLAGWQKVDVLAYLSARKIPQFTSEGGVSNAVGLSAASALWLHDQYPDDFEKLCGVFPYAEALVWRRKFYDEAAAA